MKFCNNCGQQMEDTSTFCPNCGATNEAAPAAPAAKPAGNNAFMAKVQGVWAKVQNFCKNYISAAKKDKKLIIVPAAAVVGVIAVIVVLSLLLSHPYKKAVKGYIAMDASYKATEKQYMAQIPEEAWEYLEEEKKYAPADDQWDSYEKRAEKYVEALEEEYGENYKVTFKIENASKLSDKKLKDWKDYAKENWDVSKKDVKAGYKLKLEVTIKGSEDKDSDTIKLVVIKYKGDWYVVEQESPDFVGEALQKYSEKNRNDD